MLQKICCIFILMSMVFFQSNQVFALNISGIDDYTKSRTALINTANGENYISQLETIIPELSSQKLSDIRQRVTMIERDGKFRKYSPLLNFIEIIIRKELENRILIEDISPEAKLIAGAEILNMQNMMGDSMKDMMNDLMVSWEQASNYKEEGDLNMNMNLNIEETNIEGGLALKNYEAINHMFDQKFQGELEAFMKGIADGESVDIKVETLLNFISTDGNMYLLMENLKLTDNSPNKEFITLMQPFVEKLQELGNSKTYLSFENIDAQAALETLGTLSQNNIRAQIDMLLSQPLFEAYANEGNSYMLRPSMHFCNMGKTLSGVFDPFFDNGACSESQYRDMLQEMQEAGVSLSLKLEDENTLSVLVNNDSIKGDISVSWEDEFLNLIKADLYDPSNKDINNISLKYIPNDSLIFEFMAEETFHMGVNTTLGSKGNLSAMDMSLTIEEILTMKANYANDNLSMNANGGSFGTNFECNVDGELKTNYINIDGGCVITSEALAYMFPGVSTMNIDSSLSLDTQAGKNNLDMNLQVQAGSTEVLSLEVKNSGTRETLAPATITPPIKIITQDEAFTEVYQNLYGDFDR